VIEDPPSGVGETGEIGDIGQWWLCTGGVVGWSRLGVVGLEAGGVGGMSPMKSHSVWVASASILTAASAETEKRSQCSSVSLRTVSSWVDEVL